eukprot:3258075-Rhodomonas_salina.2
MILSLRTVLCTSGCVHDKAISLSTAKSEIALGENLKLYLHAICTSIKCHCNVLTPLNITSLVSRPDSASDTDELPIHPSGLLLRAWSHARN